MFATSLTESASPVDAELHAEIRASVERLLASGEWASYRSQVIEELKFEISQQIGVRSVRLCASGSLAMELALRGCGLNAGDEVICSALDYPGNIRAVRLLQALPVIVDTGAGQWTIDEQQVESAGTKQTRAVIVSHLYGEIARVERLRALCDERGWLLIEDVCQMPGGQLAGRPLGSFGHVSAFSFGGSKPLTSGSGGAVATNDPSIAQRITTYVDRPSDATALGSLQAAVLLPQWRRLSQLVTAQQSNFDLLVREVTSQTSQWTWTAQRQPDNVACHYKIPIRLNAGLNQSASASEFKRQRTVDALNSAGIPAGLPFRAITKVANGRGRILGYKNAEKFASENILLDHRLLIGSSEHVAAFAKRLISVYNQIALKL